MKKTIFGGYDRQETERLLEEMEEKTGVASVRAAELERELEESRRKLREQAAQAQEQLRQKEQELSREREYSQSLLREKEELKKLNQNLRHTVEEFERKISKVGQIYMTAYDEADKITSGAKESACTAIDGFAGVVVDANRTMQKQLGYLMLAKESMRETMASANEVMQRSFTLFSQKSAEIDEALLNVEACTKQVKENVEEVFERIRPAEREEEQPGTDFIDVFQDRIPDPGTL